MSLQETLFSIIHNQHTIDKLLRDGEVYIKKNGGGTIDEVWELKQLYDDGTCCFGFAYSKGLKSIFPTHIHKNVKEYLVVVKGKVEETIEGNVVRILNIGDCASIPPNTPHSSRPLIPDSIIFYICVPSDPAFVQGV